MGISRRTSSNDSSTFGWRLKIDPISPRNPLNRARSKSTWAVCAAWRWRLLSMLNFVLLGSLYMPAPMLALPGQFEQIVAVHVDYLCIAVPGACGQCRVVAVGVPVQQNGRLEPLDE